LAVLSFLFYRWLKVLKLFLHIRSDSVSGAWDATRRLLDCLQLYDIGVERGGKGTLTRYVLAQKTLRLSALDYDSRSITSIGRSLYAVGHAMQHMRCRGLPYLQPFLSGLTSVLGLIALIVFPVSLFSWAEFLFYGACTLLGGYLFLACFLLSLKEDRVKLVIKAVTDKDSLPAEEIALVKNVLHAIPLEVFFGFLRPLIRLKEVDR